jgi:hypothetical protein
MTFFCLPMSRILDREIHEKRESFNLGSVPIRVRAKASKFAKGKRGLPLFAGP